VSGFHEGTKRPGAFYNHFKILHSENRSIPLADKCASTPSDPSKKIPFSVFFTTPLHPSNPSLKGMRIAVYDRSLMAALPGFNCFQAKDKTRASFLALAQWF
jgi:hypothetical protein